MKSHVSLAALGALLSLSACGAMREDPEWVYPADMQQGAAPVPYPQQGYPDYPAAMPQPGGPPPSSGPQGTSQTDPTESRYDQVGYASVRGLASEDPATASQVVAVHPVLPTGTFVEVTALDSGRTILVLVTGAMAPGRGEIALSPAAAQQLGIRDTTPVRVRKVNPSAQDQAAVRAGGAAPPRIDAPEPLLVGLRNRLGAAPPAVAAAPPVQGAAPGAGYPPPGAAPAAATPRGRYYVQVAALSNQSRAQSLAQSLGGFVQPARGLYRVQMGPFATAAEAESARARAAQRGFGDARVFTND
ncbi:SPOR domain-containing protein [Sphingosinithalassobacter sp. CS137]|uniref:SPOR domain-containing protein n=1 Tax=Sphingosinithalassobacter sp. CS137 TaxID=2762748 RepID=UPI00165DC1FB|nr:SPOR domain-containing protein [Sphingosinithalassobacter sp. CS137]